MSVSAYCSTCDRTVYLAEEDTAICPVCSVPLITTAAEAPTAEQTSD